MDMTNIYFELAGPCNFCFEQKDTEGISWLKGKDEYGLDKYYHVCEKCAEIFRKRFNGLARQVNGYYKYSDANQLTKDVYKMKKEIEKEIDSQRDIRHKKCRKSAFAFVEDIVKEFTSDEEKMLAAYGAAIKSEKTTLKSKKSRQTYIRNRLNNERTLTELIEHGFVSTTYQGIISLEDISSWYGWSEEEKEFIEGIVKMRNKYLERESE